MKKTLFGFASAALIAAAIALPATGASAHEAAAAQRDASEFEANGGGGKSSPDATFHFVITVTKPSPQ